MSSKQQLPQGLENIRGYQYQFDLMIEKVKMDKIPNIPPGYMEVIWCRGNQQIITKNKLNLKQNEEQFNFKQKVSLIATCYYDTQTKQFRRKDSTVCVVLVVEGKKKTVGNLNLNLSAYLNPSFYRDSSPKMIEEQLPKSKIKTKVFLKLTPTYLREKQKNDQMSLGSAVSSNTTTNNISNFSVTEPKQRFTQKKCTLATKLDEIPSKDTYSVLSYGGGIRYSHKKDDSASLKKQDTTKREEYSRDYGSTYGGYYNRQNPFNKTAMEYNLNRMPSNVSSTSKQKNSQSEHNKSNILGEQNSKLLADEQKARSKLQTQITRNKVQINELKNKLSEYLHQNMKLKEECEEKGKNTDFMKKELGKETQDLKNKNFRLEGQIKELKQRFEQYHQMERESTNMKTERQNLLRELSRYKDELSSYQKENENSKSQLSIVQSSQEKLMKQLQQIQYFTQNNEEMLKQQYQSKINDLTKEVDRAKSEENRMMYNYQEMERKLHQCENQLSHRENKLISHEEEQKARVEEMERNKELEMRKMNELLSNKITECEGLKLELGKVKSEVTRIKDEQTAEYEQKLNALASQNLRVKNSLKAFDEKISSLTKQKYDLTQRVKQESEKSQKEIERLKFFEEKYNEQIIFNDRQTNNFKNKIYNLEKQNKEIKNTLKEKTLEVETATSNNTENQNLLKQNLQLQLQLKYKNEELERLKGIEEQYHEANYSQNIHEQNLKEMSENYEKVQKELKEKSRAYIVECERAKVLSEERNSLNKNFSKIKADLQNAENIIFNGERQVQEMDRIIYQLDTQNQELRKQNAEVKENSNKVAIEKYQAELMAYEKRVKDLQSRNIEKLKTLESVNKNLTGAHKQIKELQHANEERKKQISQKDIIIDEIQAKNKILDDSKFHVEQELVQLKKETKQSIKRNQMLKDELYVYKKKFEEQKGRSHSALHIRSSEDFMKMRNMENELQKKDEKIRKLEKELMSLEDENVKQSIEFMKKFQDLKGKLNSQ